MNFVTNDANNDKIDKDKRKQKTVVAELKMEVGGVDTTFKEDSRVVPPPSADQRPPLDIVFSPEEVRRLEEVHRLTQHSIICKVFGSRPNRQEMRDLLHGNLQTDVGAINDVQMMGRGFYYIEFANQETRDKVLASNPLNLEGLRPSVLLGSIVSI